MTTIGSIIVARSEQLPKNLEILFTKPMLAPIRLFIVRISHVE